MCIIIHKPKDIILSKDLYDECFWRNDDGAGFVYAKDDKIHIIKGLMKFEDFYEAMQPHEKEELVIHFRNASPGMKVCKEMTHPFVTNSAGNFDLPDKKPQYTFAIVHNGKLPWRDTKTKSDTCLFIEDLIGPHLNRDPYFLDDGGGRCILGMAMGHENKMAIMRWDAGEKKSKVYIVNPEGGYGDKKAHTALGCWFSNNSYLKSTRPIIYPVYDWREHQHGGGYGDNGGATNPRDSAFMNGKREHSKHDFVKTGTTLAVPDKNGWYWSYSNDCWRNENTGTCMDILSTRLNDRPQYIVDRGDKLAKEANAAQGDLEIVVPRDDNVEESSYLSKKERQKLLKMGEEFVLARGMSRKEINNMKAQTIYEMLRLEVQDAYSITKSMDKKELDPWILRHASLVEKLNKGESYGEEINQANGSVRDAGSESRHADEFGPSGLGWGSGD